MDHHRVIRSFLRGKWWVLAAGVIGSLLGVLIGKFVVTSTYESSASLQYSGIPGESNPPHVIARDLPGLVAIAGSEPVLLDLRERLGDLEDVPLGQLRVMISVTQDAGSGLVTFTSWAESPERTAQMSNTAAEVFLEHQVERRRGILTREMASFDERIVAASEELERARSTYDAFRQANGINDLSTEQQQAIDQVGERRSQADLANAEIEVLTARIAQLRTELGRTPRTQTVSTGSSQEQRRLRQLRQLLREAQGQGLGDDHPRVQALQRQVASLERSGAGQAGSSRTSTNPLHTQLAAQLSEAETELEAARQRHESLEQLAGQAQERASRFSAIEGQAGNLLAQVNVKQALLNELNESRAHIEDQLRDIQTGFRGVAEARPPETSLPQKKRYAVVAGIPLAFVFIMLAMLLFRELRGLTLLTPSEVAFWGNGPVIGTTTWPRDPGALLHLIADMDDYAPEARGTLLVVGATESERELSVEIAAQLNHDWSSTTLIDVPVMGALPTGDDDPPPQDVDGYLDDEPLSGEIHDGPTEVGIDGGGGLLLDAPTEVSSYAMAQPAPGAIDDPKDRLICTAWSGKLEGQALRRAARLADRVLVVVTSGGMKATELASMKTRLGRDDAIGYVLIGVPDVVTKLPDRAGDVEDFWAPGSSRT